MGDKRTEHPLDVLKAMADVDLVIDKSKLESESIRTPKLHNKWLRLLFEKKEQLNSLEFEKKRVQRDQWLYFNGKADPEIYKERGAFGHKVLKNDLSMFIEADDVTQKIDFRILRKKAELEFVQKVLEEINRRSFHISNTLKALNFIHGVN